MQLLTVVPDLATFVVHLVDGPPADEDVKAGWGAFAIFIALCLAVAFLGWSLSKQLKKAKAAADAGVYDDPDEPAAPAEPVEPVASESSNDQGPAQA
ncbi:hypothetical protein [Nocardioides sp.]|uniref:hypothetical protein n=1 Tax=Nocardioides sp. TaxID=35761 RepID=UPI0037841399